MNLISELQKIVSEANVITEEDKIFIYSKGFRYGSDLAELAILPRTLLELWQVAKICCEHDRIIIMQAANTGLTGGSTPHGEYDRPVVIISVNLLKGIHLINEGKQVVAFAGSSLFELEDILEPIGREPHSVIGSSCIGASIIGGICNNSGGALIRRGPAYTEQALYARINEKGELELINHLDIELGDTPEEILTNLATQKYSIVHNDTVRRASDNGYAAKVRDVNADTPSRFNNDKSRLYEASGSAGRLIVFAVRLDTFEKAKRDQVFYIATNDTQVLNNIRRHILQNFKNLPVSGEYMHRDIFNVTETYGRDAFLIINYLGTKYMPAFFHLKKNFDRLANKFGAPKALSDRILQFITNLLPSYLPKIFRDLRDQYEHYLILEMADDGIEEAQEYLSKYLTGTAGTFYLCNKEEAKKISLHRFAAAGAAGRLLAVKRKEYGDMITVDVALKRNEEDWFERLPAEFDHLIAERFYYGHFFCLVMHQNYLVRPNVNAEEVHDKLLEILDKRGAEYPAEHNVGHLYHAKEDLKNFYQQQDPTNSLNTGIGKTSKKKNWEDCCNRH